MTTMTRPSRVIVGLDDGETRIRVPGVRYRVYESWVQSLPESTPIRMAYDGRSMELMVKGRKHDNYRELLGEIVRAITQELAIPMSSNGETTWIRPEIERGLEADQSYYFLPEKLAAAKAAMARGSNDVADYPNPDLQSRWTSRPRRWTGPKSTPSSRSRNSGGSMARPSRSRGWAIAGGIFRSRPVYF